MNLRTVNPGDIMQLTEHQKRQIKRLAAKIQPQLREIVESAAIGTTWLSDVQVDLVLNLAAEHLASCCKKP